MKNQKEEQEKKKKTRLEQYKITTWKNANTNPSWDDLTRTTKQKKKTKQEESTTRSIPACHRITGQGDGRESREENKKAGERKRVPEYMHEEQRGTKEWQSRSTLRRRSSPAGTPLS